MSDQKNLIVAIVVSVIILLGFQIFYEAPRIEQARQRQAQQQQQTQTIPTAPSQPGEASVPGGAPTAAQPATPQTRQQVLAQSPRIRIDTPRVHGSIALTGGRIDDLTLADYHVNPDPDSADIVLLAPASSNGAYYGEFGWTASGGADLKLPNADTVWQQTGGSTLSPGKPVTLTWDNGQGLRFARTIAVDENYLFTVTQKVENATGEPVTLFPYSLISRHGTPETEGFYILHEGPLGVFRESADQDGTLKELSYGDLVGEQPIEANSVGGWIGITDKYWLAALVPQPQQNVKMRFSHVQRGGDRYQVDYLGGAVEVPANGSVENVSRMFAGAKETNLIDRYEEQQNIARFDRAIDWGWFYFLTKPIFYALDYFFRLLGNFGLAILLLTVLVKLVFLPLAYKSYVAMSAMKKLQPEMMKLRERLGDDRAKLQQEMMALYKREKVNPAAGCLPILLQIPVFFALYKVLFVTIEMRHAPFYGWIKDLSAPDPTSILNLFGLLPYSVPDLGPLMLLSIGIWPILMGISMFLQMRLNPQPPDPIQAKIFMLMPIMFTFMLGTFPAGLVIYWTWSNCLSIAQQWFIMKRMGVQHPAS